MTLVSLILSTSDEHLQALFPNLYFICCFILYGFVFSFMYGYFVVGLVLCICYRNDPSVITREEAKTQMMQAAQVEEPEVADVNIPCLKAYRA